MATAPAASGMTVNVDVRQVLELKQALMASTPQFARAWAACKPEFGAYMVYSNVLEGGHTYLYEAVRPPHIREANAAYKRLIMGVTLKNVARITRERFLTTVVMPPRPHILPAIKDNAGHIYRELLAGVTGYWGQVVRGRKQVSVPLSQIEALWLRILNDKPKKQAQRNAPVGEGAHRDSISAYARIRSASDIRSEQRRKKDKK